MLSSLISGKPKRDEKKSVKKNFREKLQFLKMSPQSKMK